MGILNVTPDSFSDGGKYDTYDSAIKHAEDMCAQGASIIDVGGESTRPTSVRISADEEIARIEKVVSTLVQRGISVSIDTIHAKTAKAMIDLGVDYINDVSGGLFDPQMAQVVADSDVRFICQHWRGEPSIMDQLTDYEGDVVEGVTRELLERIDALCDSGIDRERIIADPGLGFAKTSPQSWEVLANCTAMAQKIGRPMLIGQSRKRFLADVCVGNWEEQRDDVSATISAWCATQDVWAVRVHNVASTAVAIATQKKLEEAMQAKGE